MELASEVPTSIDIHAIDIFSANFPLFPPPNVHFAVASATSLPPEWTAKFDLINQRFLFSALATKEWPEALSELFRVLKPGGTVQLVEMAPDHPVPETPVVLQVGEVVRKTFDAFGLHFDIAENLPDLLLAAGFVDIVPEKKQLPVGRLWGEIGMQGKLSIGGAIRNMTGPVVKSKACASEEEYNALLEKNEEEWDTHGTQYWCRVVLARKPVVK